MAPPYSLQTPEQVSAALATRFKELRLTYGWKQVTLARRSGVSLASLRRFEESGKVSLQNLLKLAFALNRLDDFDQVFHQPEAKTIRELEALHKSRTRKRGRI